MMAMSRNLALPALVALLALFPPVGAQENPLLQPPPPLPGLPNTGSATGAELDRMRSDMLRPPLAADQVRPPDPMQARDLNDRRLDSERLQRSLQEPSAPPMTIEGPRPPDNAMPEPRITHGRKKGAPTPAQSSPVPDRKPDAPPGP